jgi:imidazolonepropionase-like amidohydrolase
MTRRYFTIGLVAAIGLVSQGALRAQQPARPRAAAPAPAAAADAGTPTVQPPPPTNAAGLYAIQNAKIITNAGAPIDRGTIVIERGKIKAVGANVPVPPGAEIINGEGLQVYPGLFDSVSQLGLTEIGQGVNGSVDATELGNFNPQVIAATAVNPVSEHIPVARANGLTHALAVPGAGATTLGGQASAIALNGWTVEEMLIKKSVAQVLNWPTLEDNRGGFFAALNPNARRRPFSEVKADYEKKVHELEEWLERARAYQQSRDHDGGRDRDLKLEALVPVIKGEQPLLIRADRERDIKNAVEFCEKQKVKMILAHGEDSYKIADLLAKKNIPVILGPVMSLPTTDDEAYDVRNTTPGVLQKAGVKVALATFDSADSRTLPYEIANAVSYGLSWDDAFKAITLYPAQMFGLADQLGSLETGKIANLFVTNGDPLEIRTQVKYLFINGQPTSMENRHQREYDKWRSRPRPAPAPTATTSSK